MDDPFPYEDEEKSTTQQSWFKRNGLWAIPLLILGGCCVVGICITAIFGIVFTAIGSSDAVTLAVEQARQHEDVQALLGTPIEKGLLITGSVETTNNIGTADVAIPLSGPNGSGTLYAVGRKTGGEDWFFESLIFEGDSGQRIDLLE
ncbi:MAG: hypothetical protein KDE51_23370 [Anaerolineales bacterium]|nr:hypothetical protein [Anaerolineales bacterium]